jgi:formylglycine-generating enzyme
MVIRFASVALVLGALSACKTHEVATQDDAAAESDAPQDTANTLVCGTCPAGHGTMISINTGTTCFCIDATEVTQAAYLAFTTSGTSNPMPPECSFKTNNNPSNGTTVPWPPPAGTEQRPVATVDWCDATAYCSYVGKRLCGPIGGGAIDLSRAGDPTYSEMMYACSAGGMNTFPYGDTYSSTACWSENPGSQAVDVASFPGCEGGFPGLFDLSGNVMEWDAFCTATPECHVRGGGKHYFEPQLRCDYSDVSPLNRRNTDVGFRCCADPI